jgi:hypothetical protein
MFLSRRNEVTASCHVGMLILSRLQICSLLIAEKPGRRAGSLKLSMETGLMNVVMPNSERI